MNRVPHHNVYTRLKPSKIHGVGVFAVKEIDRGVYPFPAENIRWVDIMELRELSEGEKSLYRDFGILNNGQYGCPENFCSMNSRWFVNHSDDPNLAVDGELNFYTIREIKAGEELTVGYNTYSS